MEDATCNKLATAKVDMPPFAPLLAIRTPLPSLAASHKDPSLVMPAFTCSSTALHLKTRRPPPGRLPVAEDKLTDKVAGTLAVPSIRRCQIGNAISSVVKGHLLGGIC